MSRLRSQFGWSFLSQLTPYATRAVALMVLARLLDPADYGIVAMAMIILIFLNVFKDAGLGQVIIQAEDESIVNFAFTVQLLLGSLFFVVVGLVHPAIGQFFGEPAVGRASVVLALALVVAPFVDIPMYLSMRRVDFKVVFLRNMIAPLAEAAVSITMAASGAGFWSLVWGRLAGQVAAGALFLLLRTWRPRLDFGWRHRREHMHFAGHIVAQGLLAWFAQAADKAMLGRLQDRRSVGHYDMAYWVTQLPYQLLSAPINRLMYPVMAEGRRKGGDISPLYLNVIRKVGLLSIPLMVFFICNAREFISVFLGTKWLPTEYLLRCFSVVVMCATLVTLNVQAYKALGRVRILTIFQVVRLGISLPFYYWAARHDVALLALVRAASAVAFSPINAFIAARVMGIRPGAVARCLLVPVALAGAIVGLNALVRLVFTHPLLVLAANGVPALALMAGAVWRFEPNLLKLKLGPSAGRGASNRPGQDPQTGP
jgi:PST family polysaccharide transporter